MTNLPTIVRRLVKVADDHSPAVLTGVGIFGTVTTAILAAQAGHVAAMRLARENEYRAIRDQKPLDRKEQIAAVWKFYIPVGLNVTGTIVCIYGANKIGSHRTAAMAAAYTMSERAFVEYKDKVVEKIGENKEREVRDEIAQDRVDANPLSDNEVIILPGGDQLCYESWTGRYFQSTMEDLKRAQNDINYKIISQDYATLTDFYNKIGLPPTQFSDALGWSVMEKFEIQFSATIAEDGRPCLQIEYYTEPVHNFHPLH
jgi:hypothetical protein